jgi:hypothetical protein
MAISHIGAVVSTGGWTLDREAAARPTISLRDQVHPEVAQCGVDASAALLVVKVERVVEGPVEDTFQQGRVQVSDSMLRPRSGVSAFRRSVGSEEGRQHQPDVQPHTVVPVAEPESGERLGLG